MSWWDLGQHSGYSGTELATWRITCAFCGEDGNWGLEHHAEKKKPNDNQRLNFDTFKCGNCASFVMVLWSAGADLHDYKVLPWPVKYDRYPKHWPSDIGRYWLQAKRNLAGENWDAAAVMAGSAMQLALRSKGAVGETFNQEVKDLADKNVLPPIMVEWANEVKWLRNSATHPQPGQQETAGKDAQDVIRFLDFLLEYLLDLPHRINEYRGRNNPPARTG
ncbi:MAG: DUF4145 domain-containing protein [Proteobacteria bacterium]|nr:DUF4145 domain-containing protein [Pseudomonadota bacterium]